MRALAPAARAHVREVVTHRLGDDLIEFVEAVVLLVAHPLGRAGGHTTVAEVATADRVIALLERSLSDERAVAATAEELAAEPEMLAAFFQNLDLLPAGGHRAADSVAMLVMSALGRIEG